MDRAAVDAVRVSTRPTTNTSIVPDLRRNACKQSPRGRVASRISRVRPHHPGEEYIYILQGPVEIHTEFYEPIMLQTSESIYIDGAMGHAYVASGGPRSIRPGVCSSAADDLMESLMSPAF